MAEFQFSCPRCGKTIQCDTGYGGSEVECPACTQPIIVPLAGNSTASPVTAQTVGLRQQGSRKLRFIASSVAVAALVLAVAGLLLVWESRSRPIAWWRADGDARDSAGHNDGALAGNTRFAPGIIGSAFDFDGNGSSVKVARSQSLISSKEMTIEFWMNASPSGSMNSMQGLVTSDYYGVEIVNGLTFYLSHDNGRSWAITRGIYVTPGVWHHIAATYDDRRMRFYIDGQPAGNSLASTGAISPMSRSGFLTIGSEDGRVAFPDCVNSRYFTGLIDEVRIYNRALPAGEIQSHFNRR